jgi:hypothetical protein
MKNKIMNNAESFIGLSKKSAQNLAESKNMIFRLIRIDDERFLDYPEETLYDRVCIEIDQGKVTKSTIQ